jgi:hypothetical protein
MKEQGKGGGIHKVGIEELNFQPLIRNCVMSKMKNY